MKTPIPLREALSQLDSEEQTKLIRTILSRMFQDILGGTLPPENISDSPFFIDLCERLIVIDSNIDINRKKLEIMFTLLAKPELKIYLQSDCIRVSMEGVMQAPRKESKKENKDLITITSFNHDILRDN